jgi:hypothetical protein
MHVAWTEERILVGKLLGNGFLEDREADRRMILRWILGII